jgi:hypothetical protein
MSHPVDAAMLETDDLGPDVDEDAPVHVSAILTGLLEAGMPREVSLGWLTDHLKERSFGACMLVLGVAGIAPVISLPIGLLLIPLAVQLMARRPKVILPRTIASRTFPSRRVAAGIRAVVAITRRIEKFVHPRWPSFFRMKRLIGTVVLFLALSLLIPIPFTNVVPAFAIAMIALAYIERDGLVLALSLVASSIALVVALGAIYELAMVTIAAL